MRKLIIVLILAGVLVLATAVPAFADDGMPADEARCNVAGPAFEESPVFGGAHAFKCRVDQRPGE